MLQFEHSIGIWIVAVILSLLLTLFIYYKDQKLKETKLPLKIFLATLRFISLSLIALFLIKPMWIDEKVRTEKPILVFLQDNSESIIQAADSTFYQKEYPSLITDQLEILSDQFDIYEYQFGTELKQGLDFDYKQKSSNLSRAIQGISDRFEHRNLASIILASDGNYNEGFAPIYSLGDITVPIQIIALGDSTHKADLSIERVNHNDISFLDNEFPLEFTLKSSDVLEKKKVFKISHHDKIIHSQQIDFSENEIVELQVYLKAEEEGIQYYKSSLSTLENEVNTANNLKTIAIEVIDNQQEILLLAFSPHPDIAAIKSAIESSNTFSVDIKNYKEFDGKLEAYSLVILHQIPSVAIESEKILQQILETDIALWSITGKYNNLESLKTFQSQLSIKSKQSYQEVIATINPLFSTFELSEDCKSFIEQAPPLTSPFGDIKSQDHKGVLLKQDIEGIKTSKPLLSFGIEDSRYWAILLGEGLWKWRLFDYKKNENHDSFNELILAVCQHLSIQKDKRSLRLDYPKLLNENQTFHIDAQYYNQSYQLIENAELSLELWDATNNKYQYQLSPENKYYQLDLKNLSPASYQFELKASYKDEEFSQMGTFAIKALNLEALKSESDWNTLQQIADATQGKFITKDEIASLATVIKNDISANQLTYTSRDLIDLIEKKSIFFLLLLTLSLEWALRKWIGTY